jgi:hypothetical protein
MALSISAKLCERRLELQSKFNAIEKTLQSFDKDYFALLEEVTESERAIVIEA